jgi:hypothetical protein
MAEVMPGTERAEFEGGPLDGAVMVIAPTERIQIQVVKPPWVDPAEPDKIHTYDRTEVNPRGLRTYRYRGQTHEDA